MPKITKYTDRDKCPDCNIVFIWNDDSGFTLVCPGCSRIVDNSIWG